MKKYRSPVQDKNKVDLSLSVKTNIKKQLQKPYRPITDIFKAANEESKKQNASSIKQVLKQLTDLKKEVRQMKTSNKVSSQGLDMSICRKITAERRSPSSHKGNRSHSSSKHKSLSHKKEISTQAKPKNNQIKQFSFSIDSKSGKKDQKGLHYSSEEQSDFNEYPKRKASEISTKRFKHSGEKSKLSMTQRVEAIQASELYQKHLNSLKHNLDTLQISSSNFSSQQKLKLNLQIERFSRQISRIPIYMSKPELHYETSILYARNLNNQLNNFILIINKSKGRTPQDKFDQNDKMRSNKKEYCRNCEQSQKKGFERVYKKQLRRYQKQLKRCQSQLQYKNQEVIKTSQVVGSLLKQIDNYKQQQLRNEYKFKEMELKYNELKEEYSQTDEFITTLKSQCEKEANKVKLLEDDVSYYKMEFQKIKKQAYNCSPQKTNRQDFFEQKNRQLQMLVAQVKGKETLYQTMIKQKEIIIQELKMQSTLRQTTPAKHTKSKMKRFQQESEDDQQSIDSALYYRQKAQLRQREEQCYKQELEIKSLQQARVDIQVKYREVLNSLELSLGQIDKLHSEIDQLHQANEKYKDRFLKSKITSDRKNKKQAQNKQVKNQSFKEINQLIKHHKQALAREKK